jgi:hypothetical protein
MNAKQGFELHPGAADDITVSENVHFNSAHVQPLMRGRLLADAGLSRPAYIGIGANEAWPPCLLIFYDWPSGFFAMEPFG